MWHQQTLILSAKARGFHLVTDEITNQLTHLHRLQTGLLHLLLQHTSASLTLNENCDPTVRADMEQHFLRQVPENAPYQHDYEGPDDMPAHIKSSLLGASLTLPVRHGRLMLGTWQGIWLGSTASTAEHAVLWPHYRGNNPMNNSALLEYCMAKPGAEQSDQNQWQASQIKVGDVMFAMVCEVEGRPALAVKSSPELAESLREHHPEIVACDGLNKAHWNTVFLDGNLPNSQFYTLIDSSYQLVVEGLPEHVRQELRA